MNNATKTPPSIVTTLPTFDDEMRRIARENVEAFSKACEAGEVAAYSIVWTDRAGDIRVFDGTRSRVTFLGMLEVMKHVLLVDD